MDPRDPVHLILAVALLVMVLAFAALILSVLALLNESALGG